MAIIKLEKSEGEGVVGKQPNIRPGETFSYSSGAILSTKTGLMEGSYKMCTNDGLSFCKNKAVRTYSP